MIGLSKVLSVLQKLIRLLSGGLAVIAGGITFLLMLLTVGDVSLRYVFNRPIPGTYELTEWLMCIVVFFAVAYTAAKGRDIAMELVVKRFSQRIQAIIDGVTSLLSLGLISLISWQSIVLAKTVRLAGETTAILSLPNYIVILVVAAGSLALCLVLLASIVSSTGKVLRT